MGGRPQREPLGRVCQAAAEQGGFGDGLNCGARQVVAAKIIQIFQVPQWSGHGEVLEADGEQVLAPAHEIV